MINRLLPRANKHRTTNANVRWITRILEAKVASSTLSFNDWHAYRTSLARGPDTR